MSVFLAVLFGGTVGGLLGAVIALPVAASLTVIFQYVFRDQLAQIEGRDVPEALAPPEPRPRRRRRRVDTPPAD
jgi:predicted PurR-regulated permease PerM